MKKFLWALTACLLIFSCTKVDEEEQDDIIPDDKDTTETVTRNPKVSVKAGEATDNSINFTITPEDADICAYMCVAKAENLPTAEEILKKGKAADPAAESVQQCKDLKPSSEYVIVAAVSAEDKVVMSEPVYMATSMFKFTGASSESYRYSADIVFSDESDRYQMGLTFIAEVGDLGYLPAGNYTLKGGIGDEDNMVIDKDSEYTYLTVKKDNKSYKVAEGAVNVIITDSKDYKFEIDVVLENGESFTAEYTGLVEGMSVVYEISIAAASARMVNDYIPGEYYIFMYDDDWTYELYMDFYSDPSSDTFSAGTYTFSEDRSPMTFGPGSNIQIYDPYTNNNITGGTVEVSVNGDEYTIQLNVIGDNGREIAGTYTGEISMPEPTVIIQNAVAQGGTVSFEIIAMDAVECAYLCLPADQSIPDAATILSEGTSIELYETVAVELSDMNASAYVIVAAAKSMGGATSVFTQEVANEAHQFATADTPYGVSGSYVDILFHDADYKVSMNLEFYGLISDKGYLPEGEYECKPENYVDDVYVNLDYSTLNIDGEDRTISGGTVTVKVNENKEHEFTFNLNLEDGSTFKSSYVGVVTGMPVVYQLKVAEARYQSLNDMVPGEFYIKMNDADWNLELYIDFFGEAADTELQPGVYEFADTKAAMTFGTASNINMYDVGCYHFLTGGRVEVSKSGDEYTLDMYFTAENGREIEGVYTGKISK